MEVNDSEDLGSADSQKVCEDGEQGPSSGGLATTSESSVSASTTSLEISVALQDCKPFSAMPSVLSLSGSHDSSSAMQSPSDKSVVGGMPWREAMAQTLSELRKSEEVAFQTLSELRKSEKMARERHLKKPRHLEHSASLQEASVGVADNIISSCSTISVPAREHPVKGTVFQRLGFKTQKQIKRSRKQYRRQPQRRELNMALCNRNRIVVMLDDSRLSIDTNKNFTSVKSLDAGDKTVLQNPSLVQSNDSQSAIAGNKNLNDAESSGLVSNPKSLNIAGSTDLDVCFFLNILPDIKNLDKARKLAFKSHVISKLAELITEQNSCIQ